MPTKTATLREKEETPYIVVGDIKKLSGKEVVVFDLDGVLVNNTERYRLSLAEVNPNVSSHNELPKAMQNKFWRIFLSDKYIHLDKPVYDAIEILNDRRRKGYPVVIITGRTSNMLNTTLDQLKAFGVEYDVLVMRREGVYIKDYEFKERVIKSMNLHIAEVHDDSLDIINALHEYAVRGSFYWYKLGKYIYAPPVKITINNHDYILEDTEEVLKKMLEDIENSQNTNIEIRYGDYRVSLSKNYAKAFIEALYARLSKELCYPECYWIEDVLPFFEALDSAVFSIETLGKVEKVKIFGEEHPSYVDIDFDNIFRDPKQIAESWIHLRKVGILSDYLL